MAHVVCIFTVIILPALLHPVACCFVRGSGVFVDAYENVYAYDFEVDLQREEGLTGVDTLIHF